MASRVRDPTKAETDFEPLQAEIEYESRIIGGQVRPGGVVYDARKLADALILMFEGALSRSRAHIVLTNRLVSTYSRDDMRHHLRTVVFGFPSLVSIPGIVEAPARPREYYLMRSEIERLGCSQVQLEQLNQAFRERQLMEGDPRIPRVLEGLLLQAALFHLTLQPFCDSRTCRFYNAHWQEELIKSQVTSAKFCARHSKLLAKLGPNPVVSW